ncbi:MAG: ABC transporter permease [Planctomycetota bacterium]|nr:ABC transporter permease [Planctomycetota bacterium]
MLSWSYWSIAVWTAMKNLRLRKMRSGLALLGVILGVGSVIAMLAIGEGSKTQAIAQIRELGATNVIVRSVKPGSRASSDGESTGGQQKVSRIVEYGLKYADLKRFREALPTVERAIPVSLVRKDAHNGAKRLRNARIRGVTPEYPKVKPLKLGRGRFLVATDQTAAANVAVLGADAATELFGYEDPLGKDLLLGTMAFKVVGVLKSPRGTLDSQEIFVPLETTRRRFGELQVVRTAGSVDYEKTQLNEIILSTKSIEDVAATADMARKLLDAGHAKKDDFEIQVPLELLERAEEQQYLWNLVLGSIAGISLVVGGIGIMNIMLANVTEQTREIGIRRAIGARRSDIVAQFLTESVVLCSVGGLLGIVVGITIPQIVQHFAGIEAVVRLWSVVLAFSISTTMGLIFGIYPAARAARMDPIQALRNM